MNHLAYVFAAYAVVWTGLAVYVVRLALRARTLERAIEELRRQLGPRC